MDSNKDILDKAIGRPAMMAFILLVGTYVTTGQLVPGIFWKLVNNIILKINIKNFNIYLVIIKTFFYLKLNKLIIQSDSWSFCITKFLSKILIK